MLGSGRLRRPPHRAGNERGDVIGPFEAPDAASAHDFVASGRGQEFTVRVQAASGGHTGAVDVAVFTRSR